MPYETESELYPLDNCTCPMCTRNRAMETWTDDDDEPYNDDDSYDDEDGLDDLYGHGDGPGLTFRGEGPVYLGFELEVEIDRYRSLGAYAREVQGRFGDAAWLQEDSSIGFGFEITSHPMSYEWAMERFPWEVLPTLERDRCRVHQSVGLHVHVDRRAFSSECHLYRWMKFAYRNESQVQRLARRESDDWASFHPEYRKAVKHYAKGRRGGEGYDHRTGSYIPWNRYQAINPTNSDTLEVRVFASSLRPSEVQAALAFVDSTVEYTRDLDASKIIKERGWAWRSYVDWTRERPQYRPITDELEALACVS